MSEPQRIDPERIGGILRAARDSTVLPSEAKSFLVHDLTWMRRRLASFQEALPNAQHALAIKANPLVEVLKVAVAAGFGLEAAGIEEVALAVAAGCPPARIVFDSPAKTPDEIDQALRLGVVLNMDNFVELSRVEAAMKRVTPQAPIGFRINPEVGVGSIGQTSVAGRGSKFGVSISKDKAGIVQAFQRNQWLNAIHTHVGSQGCGLDLLVTAIEKVEQLRLELQDTVGRRIPYFNIGGGLPAAYLESDSAPTPQDYATRLRERVPTLFESDVTLFSEFGRAIQANCGTAFSRVEMVRTTSDGQPLAVIHLGADFLLRPIYRSNEWKHEYLCFDRTGRRLTNEIQPVTLAGPLCFAGDVLGHGIQLPKLREGDWVAIRDTGAYTLSMWSRHCNRAIPTVLGFEDGKVSLIRRSENDDDIVRLWS